MQQQQVHSPANKFNRTGPSSTQASTAQQTPSSGANASLDSGAGSNGDQYFSATFNAMGLQDFPPFHPGSRPRAALSGGLGKPFGSSTSAIDQMPDDFSALTLAVGSKNKSPAGDFPSPKSPGLPHSSSTSSFASYASMFGGHQSSSVPPPPPPPASTQQQSHPPISAQQHNSNMFGNGGQNQTVSVPTNGIITSDPAAAASAPPPPPPSVAASMYNNNPHVAPISSISTQNNAISITRPSFYPPTEQPPHIPPPSNISQSVHSTANGLVYTSSLSPAPSPRMSPVSSPLARRRLHNSAHIPSTQSSLAQQHTSSALVQESVGGTTYFYSPDEFMPQNEPPQIHLPSFCAYPGMPSHIVHLKMKSSVPQYFAPDELKMDILNRHVLSMMQIDPSSSQAAELPDEIDNYQSLCPLERMGPPKASPSLGNMPSTTYKAVSTKDGLYYCLRRIHGYRLNNTKINTIIENWKRLYHPNVIQLKEVFTTKAFNDNSIVFVYDYYAGAETMMSQHFSSHSQMNGYGHGHGHGHGHHNHHHYSRDHGKNSSPRNNNLLAEGLIWTYIVQLSSALRAIHSAGLAVRCLDPSRIVITGKARLRINCLGILDIITPDNAAIPSSAHQQEDLTAMGRIILALACNNIMSIQRDFQAATEMVQRNYSPDLKNLIDYLLQNPNRVRSVNDVMPMIGARFFTQLDHAQLRSDVVEHELAKEIENGRLFRIMVKLGSINERPEYNSEPSWAETGDRFMLKLFRDYLFHQVDEAGVPWIDMAHIIHCLNKFDAGVQEKTCLVSRDENNMLVVSYAELKRCFQSCFHELVSSNQTSTFS